MGSHQSSHFQNSYTASLITVMIQCHLTPFVTPYLSTGASRNLEMLAWIIVALPKVLHMEGVPSVPHHLSSPTVHFLGPILFLKGCDHGHRSILLWPQTGLCADKALLITGLLSWRQLFLQLHIIGGSLCAACSGWKEAVKGSFNEDSSQGISQTSRSCTERVFWLWRCSHTLLFKLSYMRPPAYCFPCLHTAWINNL